MLDFRDTIAKHPIPISIIQGDRDYVDPGASHWRTTAGSNPQVLVSVMPAASHYAWIDAPREFEAAFASALRRRREVGK